MILARAARAGRDVVLEVRVAAADLDDPLDARPRASGARPRFVWISTPVALSTRRSARPPCRRELGERAARPRRRDRSRRGSRRAPRSRAPRAAATASARRLVCAAARREQARPRTRSTEGSDRSVHGRECRGEPALGLVGATAPSDRRHDLAQQRDQVDPAAARADLEHALVRRSARGGSPAAMFVTHEIARQRMPMCRAASTSGTVDIPTRSAPSVRSMRISAGVSNAGPEPRGVDALGAARARAGPPPRARAARSAGS